MTSSWCLYAPVSVEKQPEKPSIDLSAIKDITIVAGHDLKMALPISGHPPPTVSWEQDGSPVDTSRAKLDVRHTFMYM